MSCARSFSYHVAAAALDPPQGGRGAAVAAGTRDRRAGWLRHGGARQVGTRPGGVGCRLGPLAKASRPWVQLWLRAGRAGRASVVDVSVEPKC